MGNWHGYFIYDFGLGYDVTFLMCFVFGCEDWTCASIFRGSSGRAHGSLLKNQCLRILMPEGSGGIGKWLDLRFFGGYVRSFSFLGKLNG